MMKLERSDLIEDCRLCIDGYRYIQGKPGDKHTVTQVCDCVDGKRPTEIGTAILELVRLFAGR
jgi:hypothetical protein